MRRIFVSRNQCPYCGRQFETTRCYIEYVCQCEEKAYRRDQQQEYDRFMKPKRSKWRVAR